MSLHWIFVLLILSILWVMRILAKGLREHVEALQQNVLTLLPSSPEGWKPEDLPSLKVARAAAAWTALREAEFRTAERARARDRKLARTQVC